MNSTKLEIIGHFKYLGSYKTEDGKCSKYINARICQAKQNMVHLNNIWKDHSLPLQLKLKILKCLIYPVMMYGCAAWTLIKADEKKIEAAEMWFYRRLLRVKWTEKRTNKSVSKEIGSPKQMLETINVRKLKYVGHICRHTDIGLMLNVLQRKTQSARKRGRPPISYIENIKKSLGLNLQNINYESQDRNRWRHIVDRASCGATTIATDDAD